jgi:hypothetical protein
MLKLRNQLTFLASGITTFVAHHYGSKLLYYRADMEAANDQTLRDQALTQDMSKVHSGLDKLSDQTKGLADKISELISAKNVNNSKLEKAGELLDISKKYCDTTKEILEKGSEQITPEYYSKAFKAAQRCQEAQNEAVKAVKSLLEDINKNNFLPGLDNLYHYLNSLNLLELSALFNLLILFLICILLFNIISTLLSNEIMNYFNLEKRFPKISNILK